MLPGPDGGYGTEQTPMDLDSIVDVLKIAQPLAKRGYTRDDIEGIFQGNFLRFLREQPVTMQSVGECPAGAHPRGRVRRGGRWP